ncbi:MAG: TonB-dependent receptor [Pseudomonadota bacterium]
MNNNNKRSYRGIVLMGTAAAAALFAGQAMAQQAAAPAASQNQTAQNQTAQNQPAQNQTTQNQAANTGLEQVVVTATRQSSTVNKVALSVTAQSQHDLDQQGTQQFKDLVGNVPGLFINQSLGTGLANVEIRGIAQGSQGAATTGFYLDDTPISKRNVGGGVATSNGTPLPPLFDLQRVEVLRGPQGTLYGSGSEGGTVRYITPAPDLDKYSFYAKTSASITQDGSPSWDAGLAVGGPIIDGKLGFRISYYDNHRGGWIDIIDPVTQQNIGKDANYDDTRVFHGALLWAPRDDFRVNFSYLNSGEATPDSQNFYSKPIANKINIPQACFNTSSLAGTTLAAYNGTPLPHSINPAPVSCASAGVTYVRPALTYGPYNLQKYQVLGVDGAPATTVLNVASLSFEKDFDGFTAKLINSYVNDTERTTTDETSQSTSVTENGSVGGFVIPQGFPLYNNDGLGKNFSGHFVSFNKRQGVTEELRFSNTDTSSRLNWVAGIYYNEYWTHAGYTQISNMAAQAQALFGMTEIQRYGVPAITPAFDPDYPGNIVTQYGSEVFDHKDQELRDKEIAAYAEVNYNVTDALQLTVGLRQSEVGFHYHQSFYGAVNSNNNPTLANGLESLGNTDEKPFTPKFGVKYQFDDDVMAYATAAKGFRPGGVNARLSPNICGPAAAQYGLTVDQLPTTYKSDTVWSYEAGAKARMFDGMLQLNGDVYRIDWKNVQATQSPGFGCGIVFTANAGGARSQGVELEAQAILAEGLVANAGFELDNAEYTSTAAAIHGPIKDLDVALKGQPFAIPPWTLNLGARYSLPSDSDWLPYVRADLRLAGAYNQSEFGLGTYTPDVNHVASTQNLNLRVGVEYNQYDINLFILNATNYDNGITNGGRSGCKDAACSPTSGAGYSAYTPIFNVNAPQPRTIGIQLAYRQ